MSLVPYASSDISDSEDEETSENTNENSESQVQNDTNATNTVDSTEKGSNGLTNSIFHLPTPKNNLKEMIIEEENDEFLQKKPDLSLQEKKPVKITIPSLSQFKEDDTDEVPIKKFRSASSKGTGLFAVLPPPKGGKIITPMKVLANSKNTNSTNSDSSVNQIQNSTKSAPLLPRVVKKMVEEKLKQKTEENLIKETKEATIAEDDDDIGTTDFFSLDRKDDSDLEPELEPEPEPEPSKTVLPDITPIQNVDLPTPTVEMDYNPANQTRSNNPLGLDEEALKVLVGSRGKRKNEIESAAIVDLHETDIKPDNREWFQQALLHGTGPDEGTTVKAVPGGILKRKHQITYLAQQAKANEQQLKNQWAQNRATRQQTQSKYGF